MTDINPQFEKYKKDPRIPCRYGVKCYQKNSAHMNKYKHPPQKAKRRIHVKPEPSKKLKLDETIEKDKKNTALTTGEQSSLQIQTSKNEGEAAENIKQWISDTPSNSEDENMRPVENSETSLSPSVVKLFDPKLFIKSRFLVDVPDDFYSFWDYCKEQKPSNPCDAFKDVGLQLVGPYDALAGKFKDVKKSSEDYLRHWRYYYDPPELLTVIKGDNVTGYHIGYFFDSPDEPPVFLVSSCGTKDGVLRKMGDNLFAAVIIYLEELQKIGDPFKKMHIGRLLLSLKSKTEKLKMNISSHSQKMKERESKVVAKTFNKIGLVVPYDKKTQLGYRDLAMSDKELMILLNKLDKASVEQKSKYLSELQPVLTYANIALDECDFGTGVKLGWELLYHGTDCLNSTIIRFLSNSYKYLKKDAFAKIAEAHLSNRKKDCHLSIV